MPTIKLYANLRNIAGTKELSTTGASLGGALSDLVKQYPAHLTPNPSPVRRGEHRRML
jgi:molybdopterin converting factor small subunit